MMKSGLLLIGIALLLGGLVGTLVVRDPGYVLIAYADSALETSLWFALVALVVGYFLLRLIIAVFSRTAKSGGKMGRWFQRRKDHNSRNQTVQGMLLLAQGDWTQARKLLTSSASHVETPLINYLAAARAAHELGDLDGRDSLLREARESTPGSGFAVDLTQAELQQSASQWEQCLATLLRLRDESPRHALVLKMLVDCYQHLRDYPALLELLPDAKKAKVYSDADFQALVLDGWSGRISAAGESVEQVFSLLPKDLKHQPRLVACYASALQQLGQGAVALPEIKSALRQGWDSSLVRWYGELQGDQPAEQLLAAEGWLRERPNDAIVLLTLGRISLMNQEWAKAREYLEASLRQERTPEVYAELGRLCTAMGDLERGSEYLQRSLEPLPELPLPG